MDPYVHYYEPERGITVAVLNGRLNLGNMLQAVESSMLSTIRGGTKKLIVDLTDVSYIDSAGIGMLVGCSGQAEQAGVKMRIAGAQGSVAKSFEIVHLNRLIGMDPSVETALRALRTSSATGD